MNAIYDNKHCSITICGDGVGGKTTLLLTYASGKPMNQTGTNAYVPTIFDEFRVNLTVKNGAGEEEVVSVQLNDTAGQEDYDRLRPLSYPSTTCFILTYNTVDPTSFENIRNKWIPEIRHHMPHTPILLVGTKLDLKESNDDRFQRTTRAQAEALVDEFDLDGFVECSSLTGYNVKRVFDKCVALSLQAFEHAANKKFKKKKNCNIL